MISCAASSGESSPVLIVTSASVGSFVRVGDAGEFLQNAGPRLGIKPLAVALLADFDRGGNVHQNESAVRLDQLANVLSRRVIGCDGRANRDPAILRDFRRDISNAANVNVAMLFRESQFRGKMLAHQVAVEQSHRTSAHFQELGHQHVRNRGLARTRQSR